MKLPMTITFRGTLRNEWIEAEIRKRAEKLETRDGRRRRQE